MTAFKFTAKWFQKAAKLEGKANVLAGHPRLMRGKHCPCCGAKKPSPRLKMSRLEPNQIDGMSMERVHYIRKTASAPWIRVP